MRPSSRLLFLISAALLVVSSVSYGSGFSFFEQGAKATAMGGAFAATADDPSAIWYNVAGLAQQRKADVMFGGTTVNFSNQFTGDPNDPFTSGTTGHYARHTFVLPNTYAVVPVGQNLTFGVGVYVPFGLRTNWADPWVGRFSSRDANVKTLSLNPSLAWQTTDGKFAFGVGAEYRKARIALNRNIGAYDPFNQRIADVGNAYLSSDWENKWGWTAGVLFKPSSAWRIGASYHAAMTIDFGGTATFTQIPTGNPQFDALAKAQLPPSQNVATSIAFPATLIGGVAYSGWNNWTIEADVTHTTWSRFKDLSVAFLTTPQANFTRPQNWKDTYSYRLGVNKDVTPTWSVRFGGVYDQNPQPTNVVSPLLPDSDRIGGAFGVGWRNAGWHIDATEFALHFKNRSTQGQSLEGFNGSYKTNANLVTVDFGYRF